MIELEHIGGNDVVERNFNVLRNLVIDTGGESVGIRFGSLNVTWPGGTQDSDTSTVTHGLGKAPAVVMLTSTVNSNPGYGNVTDTSFDVQARTVDGTSPAAATERFVSWIAIG